METIKFYRYESPYYNENKLELRIFIAIKETPKGYWISPDYEEFDEKKRWISKGATRRFAYPTKEQALYSFQRRKVAQLKILARQMNTARTALRMANEIGDYNFTLDDKYDIEEIRIGRLISMANSNFRTTSKTPTSPIFKPNFNRDIFLTEDDMNL